MKVDLSFEEIRDLNYCLSTKIREWDNLNVDVDSRWDGLKAKMDELTRQASKSKNRK